MSSKRSDPTQIGPPDVAVLVGFPVAGHLPSSWYREHADRSGTPDRGCWWFSSHTSTVEPSGRFDLLSPSGTCYFGETYGVAVRERCGRFLAARMPIPASHLAGRVVSEITSALIPLPVADLTSPGAAVYGVTGELASCADYSLSSLWAQALFGAGYHGLLYQPRFTPGVERAVAVFGDVLDPGVPHGHGVLSTIPLTDVLAGEGYKVDRSKIPSTAAMAPDDTSDPDTA